MSKTKLRNLWFSVHKWIGLLLAILIIPLSISGAVLVYHDWLDEALNPGRYAVSGAATLPPSRYVEAVRSEMAPGERIASLRYPEHGEGPVVVSIAPAKAGRSAGGPPPRTNVYLDGANARVLDKAKSNEGAVRTLHVLHGSLMVPGVGRQIVGICFRASVAAGGAMVANRVSSVHRILMKSLCRCLRFAIEI